MITLSGSTGKRRQLLTMGKTRPGTTVAEDPMTDLL
jgi:hypothetical protein